MGHTRPKCVQKNFQAWKSISATVLLYLWGEQAVEDPDDEPVIWLPTKGFKPKIYVTVNESDVSDVLFGSVFMVYRMLLSNC